MTLVRNPAGLLEALVVVTGYTGIDHLGFYAQDVFDFDQI